MEVTGISWSAFASGAFREGAIRGRKAGCGGTTAHSWGGSERATRGIEKERSQLRRHHSPVVGWKKESEAGCGGTTAQSWGGRRRAKPAAAAPQPIRGVEE
jgi:hypothetical protein